jgi:hypothetical protein
MASTASRDQCDEPVTRVAVFKFHPHVSASQKADRAGAFISLYDAHRDLLVDMPKGGKSLGRPAILGDASDEGVSIRGSESDFGFVVEFKAGHRRRIRGSGCGLRVVES